MLNHAVIIIPVYDDWDKILPNLDKLKGYVTARSHVVFVDNLSRNKPTEKSLFPCELLVCEQKGSYAARNMGIKHFASMEYFVFTDADCIPTEAWFETLTKKAQNSPGSIIAGAVQHFSDSTNNVWSLYDANTSLDQEMYVQKGCAITANLLVPASIFREIGQFNPNLFSGGDIEFTKRATSKGFRIVYCKDACVLHPTRASYSENKLKMARVLGGQLKDKRKLQFWKYLILNFFYPLVINLKLFIRRRNQLSVRDWFLIQVPVMVLYLLMLVETIKLLIGSEPKRK